MRRGGGQRLAVYQEMSNRHTPAAELRCAHHFVIRGQRERLAAQPHEAFDVKLVARNAKILPMFFRDSRGCEYDDFAALRFAEIVSQPVHKQMVAGADL